MVTKTQLEKAEYKKTRAETIRAIVVSLSLVAGGLWAYFTFNSTLQRENAKAELQKILQEIERQPVINVKMINNGVLQYLGQQFLHIIVQLENNGTYPVELELGQAAESAPVTATRIVINSNGRLVADGPKMHAKLMYANHFPDSVYMIPDKQEHQEYLIPINDKGIFLVQFKISAPAESINYLADKIGRKSISNSSIAISTARYFLVEGSGK